MVSKASDKFEEVTKVQADAYIAGRPLIDIPREQLPQVAGELLAKGARLVYETGIDMGVDGFDLFYFFSSDRERTSPQTLLRVHVPREDPIIASLARVTPQASWAEREIMEMLGVRFTGHPDPRHLWLPYEWPRPAEADYEQNEAIMRPKGAAANLLPMGPYHPATLDSNLFRMTVEGEAIVDIDIKIGYNHRGIIKLFEGRDYHKGMFLAERVCGICNCAHTTTYCTAVEQMAAVEVPARAKYIRMLMVELERIQNHFLWLGLFVNVMGFTTGFMLSWRAREVVQDTMELVSGQRISHGMNTIGGVRKDIPSAVSPQVAQRLEDIRGKVAHLERIIRENPLISDRARSIGALSPQTAREYGALGPVMRGSGNRVDVRLNKPYLAYNDVDWHIVTNQGRDAYARMLVRVGEMHVSLDICEQALDNLEAMPAELAVKGFTIEEPYGLAQVEAPRGEVVYLIAASEYVPNMPHAVRIRTPTYNNLPLLKTLLVGCDVGDVPVILSSIDPCFACTDRLAEVSKTHNRVEFAWTWNG